ncbi:MAG: glycosyltransferase family 2 protein, partial [Ignavibacteriales bacterium]|nr:glycosyltransferase family 2 protein [Ignavibacteriales bacterium]
MPNPTKEKHSKSGKPRQDKKALFLSIVVPLMNEAESLMELYDQILRAVTPLRRPFELIFIDDGSTDASFQILEALHNNDKRVKVIRFRRNFGKSAALSVGFKEAEGEFVVTMDADLQDDPAEIPGLITGLLHNYDLISGWKQQRNDPLSKTIPSRFFNFVTAKVTGIPIHDFNCGLKAYRKEVVKEVDVHGELHRYIPALAHWAGYKVGEKTVHHRPRKYGRTKFGASRFLRGFLDLLTVLFTTRYIRRPLHLFGLWGIILFLVGLFIDEYLSIEWLLGKTSLSNRPLFLVGILFIIIGIQFVSFGLLGEMIIRQKRDDHVYSIREIL